MVSFDAALAVFLLVTVAMFIIVALIFDVWGYVLLFYFITLCAVGGVHLAQLNSSSRRGPSGRTIYSSRMYTGNNSSRDNAERELRERIEREFETRSVYDDAETMK